MPAKEVVYEGIKNPKATLKSTEVPAAVRMAKSKGPGNTVEFTRVTPATDTCPEVQETFTFKTDDLISMPVG